MIIRRWRALLVPAFFVALNLMLGAAEAGGAGEILWASSEPVSRRMVGDWEKPDLVVVGYAAGWEEGLTTIVRTAAAQVEVLVMAPDGEDLPRARRWLSESPLAGLPVRLLERGSDSVWVRDFGPISAVESSGQVVWLDAGYGTRPGDDVVPQRFGARWRATVEPVPEELDGGGLASNGRGLCASSAESFEHARESSGQRIEVDALLAQLGCQVVALLPALSRDATKHVDMFAQFVGPESVIVAELDPTTEPEDARRMDEAATRLSAAAQRVGLELEVWRIPIVVDDGIYLTYLNGFQMGDTYLAPHYDRANPDHERVAFDALSDAMPGREIVPVEADAMIELGGAVHCVTLGMRLPIGT